MEISKIKLFVVPKYSLISKFDGCGFIFKIVENKFENVLTRCYLCVMGN